VVGVAAGSPCPSSVPHLFWKSHSLSLARAASASGAKVGAGRSANDQNRRMPKQLLEGGIAALERQGRERDGEVVRNDGSPRCRHPCDSKTHRSRSALLAA